MAEVLAWLIEILWEILINCGFELLVDWFSIKKQEHSLDETKKPPDSSYIIALFGGFGAGVLSLLIFHPSHKDPLVLRLFIGAASAFAVGFFMHRLGKWREGKGKMRRRLEYFWPAALFALCISLTRIWFIYR
ncbi:MAG: hypothetical protein AB1405_05790 [Bdellovibrionota bacterium]